MKRYRNRITAILLAVAMAVTLLYSGTAEPAKASAGETGKYGNIYYEERSDGTLAVIKCDDNIAQVAVPSSIDDKAVTEIANAAFAYCTYLGIVQIPSTVTLIDQYAFSECASLTDIYYTGTEAQWNAITFGKGWNNGCPENLTIHYLMTIEEAFAIATPTAEATATPTAEATATPTAEVTVAPTAEATATPTAEVTAEPTTEPTEEPTVEPTTESTVEPTVEPTTEPTVEPTVAPTETPAAATVAPTATPAQTSTDDDDEDEDDTLKKGSIVKDTKTNTIYRILKVAKDGKTGKAEYVRRIKKNSNSVTIRNKVKLEGGTYKVTQIAKKAFYGDNTLEEITIGKNVTWIRKRAFKNCKNLTDVTIGKNVEIIGIGSFRGCTSLEMVTIPKNVEIIRKKAFYGCASLKYIMVKSTGISWVGEDAFANGNATPRVKTDESVWRTYAQSFIANGLSGNAVFVIDPVPLVN